MPFWHDFYYNMWVFKDFLDFLPRNFGEVFEVSYDFQPPVLDSEM